eukprot:gene25650-32036_t
MQYKLVVISLSLTVGPESSTTSPSRWSLLGSQDGSVYTTIFTQTYELTTDTSTFTVGSTTSYKLFRFVCEQVGVSTATSVTSRSWRLAELVLYGYETFNDVTIVNTPAPSSLPLSEPSSQPSSQPSSVPTQQPSRQPSSQPSAEPSRQPTAQPTRQPLGRPSGQPSRQPSSQPSRQPSS